MNSDDAAFAFPVFIVTPDRRVWTAPDRNVLTRSRRFGLKDNVLVGTEFIDLKLRRWRVTSYRSLGRVNNLFQAFLYGGFSFRLDYDLEPMSPVSLSDVQERFVRSIQDYIDRYLDDDSDELPTQHEQIALARAAGSMWDLHATLDLDTIEGGF